MGSSVEPSVTAPEHLNLQRARLSIPAVQVGDLKFAARRWNKVRCQFNCATIVKVETRHRHMRFRTRRLFFNRSSAPLAVEANNAVCSGVPYIMSENG